MKFLYKNLKPVLWKFIPSLKNTVYVYEVYEPTQTGMSALWAVVIFENAEKDGEQVLEYFYNDTDAEEYINNLEKEF